MSTCDRSTAVKGPAFVRTKLKNVLSGKVVDKTYNAGVKVETATVDRRDATYLSDGSDFVFMDSQDYEQHHLPDSLVGDAANYLLESMPVQVAFHDSAPLYLELPVTVELVVTHTEPGLQGDRSSAGTKPATLETGATINVPLFINTGDKLKVDSRDGSYLVANADGGPGVCLIVEAIAGATRPANAPSTCCSRPRRGGSPPPKSRKVEMPWRRRNPTSRRSIRIR